MRRRFIETLTAVALLAAVLLAGCSGDKAPTAEATTTTGPRSTPTTTTTVAPASSTTTSLDPVAAEEQEILDTVQAAWAAIEAAKRPPNPDDPALPRYLTGDALRRSTDNIAAMKAAGQTTREVEGGHYGHRPRVIDVTADTAVVIDCVIDDLQIIDMATGLIVNGEVITRRLRTTLVRSDGSWRLADNSVEAEWFGVAECDGY